MFRKKLEKPFVSAVVPAAGNATRMQGLDKQFEEIAGVPVIVHTMLALSDSDWIDEIVVVARQDDIPDMLALIRAYAVPKIRSVVAGGATRQESVQKGVNAVSEKAQFVAIHDGARPLVSQQVIAEAVISGIRYGAATAAVPAVDTIKMADENKMITATPDRSRLFAVQTPQVFAIEKYREAVQAAWNDHKDYSDDCQMIEAIGQPVYLSEGNYQNLKITTPVDLVVAQTIVENMEAVL